MRHGTCIRQKGCVIFVGDDADDGGGGGDGGIDLLIWSSM